jgi:DNA polymerase-1
MPDDLYRFIHSGSDVADFTAWCEGQRYITIDTETTSLDYHHPDFRVRLIQVGNRNQAWLARLPEWPGLFNHVFQNFPGRLVIHNASFDVPSLARHDVDVPWRKIDDTMLALRILQPNQPSKLKPASRRLLGGDGGGEQALKLAMKKQKWRWEDIPLDYEPFLYYAALDVILASRIYELDAVQKIVASSVFDLEMDVRAICSRMEANGMRIDREFTAEKFAELRSESDRLKLSYHGIVSLTSTDELGRWFISNTERGLLTKKTRGGRVAVDKDVLERVAAYGDRDSANVAKAVLRVRKIDKMASAYFSNFLGYLHEGVVHPSINTMAARTSRMSISNPALQTLPKPSSDPDSRMVRRAIIPLREGEVMLSADMDQIELRIAASLAEDRALAEAFSEGDFFLKATRDIYGDPAIIKTDDRRQVIKTFFYSFLYGAGVETMSIRAGIPVARMAEVKALVSRSYPGLSRMAKRIEREARNSGGVMTLGGRFLPVDPHVLYAGTNYVIQASAAEFLKRSLVALASAGFEDYLLAPVHDEVVFSIPEGDVEEASHAIIASMESRELMVPLTASINGPGKTWADLT